MNESIERLLSAQAQRLFALPAAADLSSSQYYVVQLTSDLTVEVHDPADGKFKMVGVLQNAPVLGASAIIRERGFSLVVLAGTVAADDWLEPSGSSLGRVVKLDPSSGWHGHPSGAGNPPSSSTLRGTIGMACQAGVSGDVILARLFLGWR